MTFWKKWTDRFFLKHCPFCLDRKKNFSVLLKKEREFPLLADPIALPSEPPLPQAKAMECPRCQKQMTKESMVHQVGFFVAPQKYHPYRYVCEECAKEASPPPLVPQNLNWYV